MGLYLYAKFTLGGAKTLKELFQLNTTVLFWIGFIPPLFAAIFAILTAILLHQEKITNYVWICGRAFLPSLSRIINLSLEGLVWQLCIFFHIPFRLLELATGWVRYGRLENTQDHWRWWYGLHRHLYAIFGVLELILLTGLSAVGEKEHGIVHVCLFYSFGVVALLFFISNTVCHSQSLYFLNPYGRISYYIKIAISLTYFLSAPAIATFYALYWKACFTWAYELFALVEYFDVFMVIFYHGCCVYWDIQHKVIFSIRYEPPKKKVQEEHQMVVKRTRG
ncbi:unnamed protein product [Caenorhabditis bovis]|uniref:CWH43-like N-terminal domain-containing protein n=1 Tax=Caenorhabditis bovis TaxID=2654633 RepID=A0A8S1F1B3_9PELO|nr:unnamed protein product [Caenorhabditis bovis]